MIEAGPQMPKLDALALSAAQPFAFPAATQLAADLMVSGDPRIRKDAEVAWEACVWASRGGDEVDLEMARYAMKRLALSYAEVRRSPL